MPQIKSAFKRLKQDKKKYDRNKSRTSEMRSASKSVTASIAAGKKDEAEQGVRVLESKMDKAAKKNIIKKNTVSRKISRLRSQIDKIK